MKQRETKNMEIIITWSYIFNKIIIKKIKMKLSFLVYRVFFTYVHLNWYIFNSQLNYIIRLS